MATNLVEYGIQTETSDMRVHVCVVARRLYVYPTRAGLTEVESGKYKPLPVYQWVNGRKVLTAEGYAVPVTAIHPCTVVYLPDSFWMEAPQKTDSTSVKGQKAEAIVMAAISYGYLPVVMKVSKVVDLSGQIAGGDLRVSVDALMQVKCDFEGGHREFKGSGHLYLQIKEANPLKRV